MSIKRLVNTHEIYSAFLEELDSFIERERRSLENCIEPREIYRHQGSLKMLRELKSLREVVNQRK